MEGQSRGSQRGGPPIGSFVGQVLTADQLRQSLVKKPGGGVSYAQVQKKNDDGVVRRNTERVFRPDDEYVQLRKMTPAAAPVPTAESLDLNVTVVDATGLPARESQDGSGEVVRGVLELSSLRQDVVSKVPIRLVCVVDVSGSMRLKCGRSRRESKLAKLKKMAVDLLDALESDQDYVALVTFGVRPRTLCPLTRVDDNTREYVKEAIKSLDKETDNITDLSSGLFHAVDILKKDASISGLSYKNAIIVFSDGEINAGLTSSEELVHTVKERIKAARPEGCPAEQWLSLSCVTTGGNVSEGMYLLSKTCGNDAYYYVDGNTENPEVDMMIPILLRKSSAAQLVTLEVQTSQGAQLVQDGCSREHSLRRRRDQDRRREMTYFLHDMPAGTTKHFDLSIDVSALPKDANAVLMELRLFYVDGEGCQHQVTRQVRMGDVLRSEADALRFSRGLLQVAKGHLRHNMQLACRKAAEEVARVPEGDPGPVLSQACSELQKLADKYAMHMRDDGSKRDLNQFCAALLRNLGKLMDTVEKSQRGAGHKWTKIRAISSAITRESPGVSGMVSNAEVVCPLPMVRDCATTRMKALAMKLYQSQDVRSTVYETHGQKLFKAATLVARNLGDIIRVLEENATQDGGQSRDSGHGGGPGNHGDPPQQEPQGGQSFSDEELSKLLTINFD